MKLKFEEILFNVLLIKSDMKSALISYIPLPKPFFKSIVKRNPQEINSVVTAAVKPLVTPSAPLKGIQLN